MDVKRVYFVQVTEENYFRCVFYKFGYEGKTPVISRILVSFKDRLIKDDIRGKGLSRVLYGYRYSCI